MLGYFPTPYRNELIVSLFARYHKFVGNILNSQTTSDLVWKK